MSVASIIPIVALFQVFNFLNGLSGGIMRARGMQVRFCISFILEQKLTISVGQVTGALLNLRCVNCLSYFSSFSALKAIFHSVHTICLVNYPCRPWNSHDSTDVLRRYSIRDLADLPTEHGTAWTLVWPDRVAHIRFSGGGDDGTAGGLEQGVREGAETAGGSKGAPRRVTVRDAQRGRGPCLSR